MSSDEAAGDAEDLEDAPFVALRADATFDGYERVISLSACSSNAAPQPTQQLMAIPGSCLSAITNYVIVRI